MLTETTQSPASERRPRLAAVSVGLLASGFFAGISGPATATAVLDGYDPLAETDAGVMVAQRHQQMASLRGAATARAAVTVSAHRATITLFARPDEFGAVDTGEPGDTVGDLVAFTDRLLDRADEAVGHAASACMRTSPLRGESHCAGTLVLDDQGTIAVQGLITDEDGPPLRIAVVGGTGAYNGASGTMTVTVDPADPDGLRLAVRLLR